MSNLFLAECGAPRGRQYKLQADTQTGSGVPAQCLTGLNAELALQDISISFKHKALSFIQ